MRSELNRHLYWQQKDMIDAWMDSNGYPVMELSDIEKLMGGFGENRPKLLVDVYTPSRKDSWPHRWFSSGQTDANFYLEPEHVYETWWQSWFVSRSTYANAARIFFGANFLDIGGTIWSAHQLLLGGAESVNVTNFEDGVLRDFSWWYRKTALNDTRKVLFPSQANAISRSSIDFIGVMSEYLEHFVDVDAEFEKWTSLDSIVVANGFCVPAHGHYIPIAICGTMNVDREKADDAFLRLAESHGYTVRPVNHTRKNILVLER